ncbi:hypothetical protein BGX29_004943, partial [Mortierella sp. GBA35]
SSTGATAVKDSNDMDLDNITAEELEIAALETRQSGETRVCYNCNTAGHIMRHCPKPKPCLQCGRSGHIAKFCPLNKRNNSSQYTLQSYHVKESGDEPEIVSSLSRPVHEVRGYIGKRTVRVLIDSGASANFISGDLLPQLGKMQYRCVPMRAPVKILLARGQVSTAQDVATLGLRLYTEDPPVAGIVIDNLRYDLILGQPWLRQWDPQVKWKTGEYQWQGNTSKQRVQSIKDQSDELSTNNTEAVETKPRPEPEVDVRIVGHKHFKRILRKPDYEYGVCFPIQ